MKKIKFFGIFFFILSSLVFLVSCGKKEKSNNIESSISQSSESIPSSEIVESSEATESSEESQSVDLNNFNLSSDGKTILSLTDYGKNQSEIVIPNTVENIGHSAFYECVNLISVTIPNSVKSIGSDAFRDCSSLTKVSIPNSVTSIEYNAFLYCISLVDVKIGNGVTKIESSTFSHCALTSITIPNGVTTIDNCAFDCCPNLTSVSIPASVKEIRNNAFLECYKLVEIINKSSLNITIGSEDYGCIALFAKQVISDEKESKISTDSNGFITYNDGTDIWLVNYIGNDNKITIPSNVTRIDDFVFLNRIDLKSIKIPEGVISIGEFSFNTCASITSITVPNSVKSIGTMAFAGCYGLVEIISKSQLSFELGSTSYGSIAEYAKQIISDEKDSKLSTDSNGFITYNDGTDIWLVGYIGDDTKITIPSYITKINDYAFCEYRYLISITILPNITSIGVETFFRCSNLSNIVIPNSITSIEGSAFSNCEKLSKVYYKGTSPYTDTITSIGLYNEYLINATWYYFTSNGESETKSGNWWYYDTDGETIIEKVIE